MFGFSRSSPDVVAAGSAWLVSQQSAEGESHARSPAAPRESGSPAMGAAGGSAGSAFAEDTGCSVLAETIGRQEMKNTPGRKTEWMPAFFEVTCDVTCTEGAVFKPG